MMRSRSSFAQRGAWFTDLASFNGVPAIGFWRAGAWFSCIALVSASLMSASAAFGGSIIAESGYHELRPSDGPPGGMQFQSFTVPFSASYTTPNPINGASVGGSFDITSTEIRIGFDLSRPPTQPLPPLEMASLYGYIDFSVDELAQYVLSGELTAIDPEGRNTWLWLRLYENGGLVFNNIQASHATPNEHFVLGGLRGDNERLLAGSLTGTLRPGKTYRFEYWSRLLDEPSPSLQTATATGFFGLTIIPEPTTAILIALGVAGLAIRRTSASRDPISTARS